MAKPEETTPTLGSRDVVTDEHLDTVERTKEMVHMMWAVIGLALLMILSLATAFAVYYRVWQEWGVL